MKRYQAREWQRDFTQLQTNSGNGQLWSENGILLGIRPIVVLQELVKHGLAFVINSQAVNLYDRE